MSRPKKLKNKTINILLTIELKTIRELRKVKNAFIGKTIQDKIRNIINSQIEINNRIKNEKDKN